MDEKLIAEVVKDVINKMQTAQPLGSEQDKTALVLCESTFSAKKIQRVAQYVKANLTFLQLGDGQLGLESYGPVIHHGQVQEPSKWLKQFSCLIYPEPSFTTLAQISKLMLITPASSFLAEALLGGQRVIVGELWERNRAVKPGLKREIISLLNKLTEFGCEFQSFSGEGTINQVKGDKAVKFLTEVDVIERAKDGVLQIGSTTKLTPLAKDYVRARNIKVTES